MRHIHIVGIFFIGTFNCHWLSSHAQNEFYNDGANVYVQAGGLIYVQGTVINDDQAGNVGRIYNSGDIQLTGNWTNTATSNVFQSFDPGTVTFLGTGAVQTIGGTLDTYFNNLTINKSGGATQEVRMLRNSLCDGVLNLTNDFLNTQTFTFLVANPNPTAITRTGPVIPNYTNSMTLGYVSSTPGSAGRLARSTSNLFPGATYFYPLGNGTRFRPIEITPTSVGNNVYAAQLVNLPTFSTGLLGPGVTAVNASYYHFIERGVAAGSPENLRIYYDYTVEGLCPLAQISIAEWNLSSWRSLSPAPFTTNISPMLSWTQKTGYPGTYPTPWVSNAFVLFDEIDYWCNPPLPTVGMFLSAHPQGKNILLSWPTYSEMNNDGFEIERSIDAIQYESIGWMDGNGNSNAQINYSWLDEHVVVNQLYYYRLKQIDFNDIYTYSNIASAIVTDPNGGITISVFPNPSTNVVNLMLQNGEANYSLQLLNELGQVIRSEQVLVSNYMVDLSELASGIYYLQVVINDKTFSHKLIRH